MWERVSNENSTHASYLAYFDSLEVDAVQPVAWQNLYKEEPSLTKTRYNKDVNG